jgi:RHS repeat-associated protein
MRKRIHATLLICVVFVGGFSPNALWVPYFDPNREFVVSDAPGGEGVPRVSGQTVTWVYYPGSGSDIYYRQLPYGSPVNITSNPSAYNSSPDISGNVIVFWKSPAGTPSIWACQLGGSPYQLSPTGMYPRISGDLVVYDDNPTGTNRDIWGRYLSGGPSFVICSYTGTQQWPVVDKSIVVWQDVRNASTTKTDIYGKDLSGRLFGGQEFAICTAPYEQYDAEIWGRIVVWEDCRAQESHGYTDIYAYNLETKIEFPVATGPANQQMPTVCGNYIIWTQGTLKGYSLLTGQTFDLLTGGYAYQPAIDANLVVWRDSRGGIRGNYLIGDYFAPRRLGLKPNPQVFDLSSPSEGVVHVQTSLSGYGYTPILLIRSEVPMEWDVENSRIYPAGGVTEGKITFLRNEQALNDHFDYCLEPGQTYYYRTYSVDDNYWYSSGWTKSIVVSGTPRPIRAPTNVWTEPLDGKAIIHLTNPVDPNYASTLIVRSTESISWKPVDGQNYSEGQVVTNGVMVISNVPGTTDFLDTDLTNLQLYYYRVFAVTNDLKYSIGKQVTCTPTRKPTSHFYRMLYKRGGIGPGDDQFSSEGGPRGITIDNEGYIRVSDYGKREIKRYKTTGEFIDKFEIPAPESKYKLNELHYDFRKLFAIGEFTPGGPYWGTYVFELYEDGRRCNEIKLTDQLISESIGSICTGLEPNSMTVNEWRMIYVCIPTEHKVKKFTKYDGGVNFVFDSEWGEYGTNPGQLAGPLSIVRDKDGFLYVGDETGRIQKFGVNGYFYKIVSQLDPSKKEMPLDMAIDRWGCFYVATSAYRVLKFDRNWNFLTGWGRRGSGDGEFCRAARLCVDSQDNVYVSDGDFPGDPGALQNQRIQVFTETDQYGSDVTFTGYMAEPVNTATGNFTYEHTDLTVPGPGLSFKFERFYNSQDYYEGVFGKGWHHSYEMRASEREDASVVVSWPNGHCDVYERVGSSYVPKLPGVYSSLIKNGDSTFTLIRTDQIRYNFAINGKLQNIIDRNNNCITLSYSGTGRLRTITDAVGRLFTLTYNANGRVASLTDPNGRIVGYTLNANNDLSCVTDANGLTTQFLYDSKRRITKIINPRSFTLLENTYDEYNRVVKQRDAKGDSTTFDYKTTQIETPWGIVTAYTGITEVNDPLGYKTKHEYDGLNRLPTVLAADSTQTKSQYDTNDNRIAWTDQSNHTTNYQYDNRGNVIRKLDPNGGPTYISYDSYNNPLRKEDALGNVTTYTYDSNGNLIDTNDALHQITHRTYFSNGLVHTITDPNGNTTTYDYDPNSNLISVTDPLGNKTLYTYDEVGRKLTQTNALGQVIRYEYDATDHLIAITDPAGRVTQYEYDKNGNKTREIYPDGNDREFEYDELDRLVQVTDEAGFYTQYEYDAIGHLVKVTDPCGYETIHTYDKVGNRVSTKDAREDTTVYGYDSRGNLTDVHDPNGGHTIYEYDLLNRRTSVTDPHGHKTRYEYDAVGHLIRTIDPNGHSIGNAYDALGRLASTADKNGNKTSYKYDRAGNLAEITEPGPNDVVTKHIYDRARNKIATIDPLGRKTIFQYDELNRLIKTTDPLGHNTETHYDEVGRIKERIDAKGRVTTYDYDLRDRLIRVTDAAGYQTNYSYDARGNLISMVNAWGKTTTFEYDWLNRLKKTTRPLGLKRSYEYDKVGNKTALVDEDNKVTTYQYDKNNHLTQESFPDGNSVKYEYDSAGLLIKMTDSVGVTTYQYDNRDSLISKTDPFGQTVRYSYDPVGNKTSLAYPGDKSVQYFYDQYNDLIEIRDWLSNVTRYTYDLADELIGVNLPNGDVTTYDFDDAGRLIYQHSETAGGQPICEYTIELDEIGNRIAIDYNQPILPSIAVTEEVINYTYDDADRLVKAGDANYVFSNRGDLVQKRVSTNTTNYTYDSHDWLTKMAKVAEQWLYSYDGQGHRLDNTSSTGTARYTIDSTGGDIWDVLAETGADNSPKYYYIYGLGLAYLIDAHTEEPLFYHYDPISSTVALTSYSGGVVGKYSYDEFGKLNTCSCVTGNPYQYVGKFGVAAAPEGLLYMRARYYDTSTGRFLTRDPVTGSFDNPISLHDYIYTTANPMTNTDPAGKFSISDWVIKWFGPILQYVTKERIASWTQFAFTKSASIGLFSSETFNETVVKELAMSPATAISLVGGIPFDPIAGLSGSTIITTTTQAAQFTEGAGKAILPTNLQPGNPCGYWGPAITVPGCNNQNQSETQTTLWQQLVNSMNAFQSWFEQMGETGATTPEPQAQVTQKSYGRQPVYRPGSLMAANLARKPVPKPYIPERYEPKFRIINKTNAKDLR